MGNGQAYCISSDNHVFIHEPADNIEVYIEKPGYRAEIRQPGKPNINKQLSQNEFNQLINRKIGVRQLI